MRARVNILMLLGLILALGATTSTSAQTRDMTPEQMRELGDHLRAENERSGTLAGSVTRENRVDVAPQGPTRDTPSRNSWEGSFDTLNRPDRPERSSESRTEQSRVARPYHDESNPRSYGGQMTGRLDSDGSLKVTIPSTSEVPGLVLPNGDMFELPVRDTWRGNATVSVSMERFGRQMGYVVNITSDDKTPIAEIVAEVIAGEGLAVAIDKGLARVVREIPRGVGLAPGVVIETLRPSPVAADLVWRTMSAHNMPVEVFILDKR